MAERGRILTEGEAKRVQASVEFTERHGGTRKARQQKRQRHPGPGRRYAKLTAALTAPATFNGTPTSAAAVFMIPGVSGALIVGDAFTVKNRWKDLTLASGKYLIVARVAGEWTIIQSEC